jgi:hypothetical protein
MAQIVIAIPPKQADRAARFTGRTWLPDLVLDWADHGSERFLIIRGKPGSGKSACAAWICGAGPLPAGEEARAKLERVRRLWDAAYFCDASLRDTIIPSEFSRKIAEQLAVRFPSYDSLLVKYDQSARIDVEQTAANVTGDQVGVKLYGAKFSSAPEDTYQKTVARPLTELAKTDPNMKVFVVVDSLDEANTFQLPNIVTMLASSTGIAAGVRFVVTTRDDPKIVPRFAAAARIIDLSTGQWRTETDSDIRKYVNTRIAERAIAALVPPALQPDALAEKLVRVASGNFLYISFLLDEIANHRTFDDLDTLPSGLYDLYRVYLERIMPGQHGPEFSTRISDLMRNALGALSAAMDAIPKTILAKWLGIDLDETTRIFTDLTQIVTSNADGYRLYHRSLVDFFNSPEYEVNGNVVQNLNAIRVQDHHRRIARYYLDGFRGRWDKCDDYGLRYLSAHLRELAGEDAYRNELYALIAEPVMSAKLSGTGSHKAFSGDVSMALDAAEAERPPNLEQIVKCSLITAELASRARSVPADALRVLASLGRVREALDRARSIPEEAARSEALTGIAEVLLANGAAEQVYELLEPIVRNGAPPAIASRARLALMAAMVRLKNFDQAREIASQGASDLARQMDLMGLLKELTESESYDEAERILELLPPHTRAKARQEMLKQRAERGDLAGALQLAARLSIWEDRTPRSAEILSIADHQSGFEAAIALARENQVDEPAFSHWAKRLAAAGRLRDALAAARAGGGGVAIDDALAAWAAKLAGDGAIPDALENASALIDKLKRDQTYKAVAVAAAELDRFDEAFHAVSRMEVSGARQRACGEVLRLEADAHGLDAALARRAKVEPETDRAESLVVFGTSLFETGGLAVAREAAARLPADSRNRVLSSWVDIALKAGRFREAWDDAITDSTGRFGAMTNVLRQTVSSGDFALALALAASLPPGYERTQMFASALEYQLVREPIEALVTRIDETERMTVLSNVASSLQYQKRFDEAIGVASAIANRLVRDCVLRQIVSACVEERQLDAALRAARAVQAPEEKPAQIATVSLRVALSGELERAAGLAAEALSSLTEAAGPAAQVITWSASAETLARAGNSEAAVKLVDLAVVHASALGDSYYDAIARVAFPRALVSVGRAEQALQFAGGIAEAAVRSSAFAGVVYCLAPSGGADLERAAAESADAMRSQDRVGLPDPLRTLLQGLALARRIDLVPASLASVEGYRITDALKRAAWARLEAGDTEGALALAGVLQVWPDRAEFYADVAGEMAARGRGPAAIEWGGRTIELAKLAAPGSGWSSCLEKVAESSIRVGAADAMWAAIHAIEKPLRTSVASSMIPLLIQSGQEAIAISLLQEFSDQFSVIEEFVSSIKMLVVGGALDRAAVIAAALASDPNQTERARRAWQSYAVEAVKRGETGAAVEQLKSHAEPTLHQQVLRAAAQELSANFSGLAETLLPGLETAGANDGAREAVAAGLARAGRFENAIRAVTGIQVQYVRARSLLTVFRFVTDQVDVEAVLVLAGTVAEKGSRWQALLELALELTKEGSAADAETLASVVELSSDTEGRYGAVVKALAAAGEFDHALRLAARVAENSRWPHTQNVAEAAATAGKVEFALSLIQDAGWRRDNGIGVLALAVAGKSEFEEALKLTERIGPTGARAGPRATIARMALSAGHRDLAEKVISELLNSVETLGAEADAYENPLHGLAVALTRAGQPELAGKIAAGLKPGSWLLPDAQRAVAKAWRAAKENQRAVAATLEAWIAGLKIGEPATQASQSGLTVAQLIGFRAFEHVATLLAEVERAGVSGPSPLWIAVMAYRIADAAPAVSDPGAGWVVRVTNWVRRWSLRRTAARLAGSAREAAAGIEDAPQRGKLLTWTAFAYSGLGRSRRLKAVTREALDAAERISNPPERIWILCQLAVAWRPMDRPASHDLFERALAYSDRLDAKRRSGLYALYQNLPDSEDPEFVERAVKLLESCDDSAQASLLSTLVRAMAQSHQTAQASALAPRLLELGEMLPDNPYLFNTRPNMFNAIEAIAAIADDGQLKALVQSIRDIPDVAERARLGSRAAAVLAPIWHSEVLTALLNDAVGWVEAQTDPQPRVTSFDNLTTAFAAAKDCDQATRMLQEAISGARLVSAASVVQSLAGTVPCLAGTHALEGICNAVVEVRRWWPELPRKASG